MEPTFFNETVLIQYLNKGVFTKITQAIISGSKIDRVLAAAINRGVNAMISACKKANQLSDAYKKAMAYCKEVFPFFEEIRYHCDKLELIVDASLWPMAKYRQLLFMQ